MITATGPGVQVFRAMVMRRAISFYLRTGMKVNRAYTPKNMLRTATAITGKQFGRWSESEARSAIDALSEWIDSQRGSSPSEWVQDSQGGP